MNRRIPAAVKTAGTRRAVFIPGGAADVGAITVEEMNSGDNIGCYFTANDMTGEQASIPDRRWCSSEVFEIPGEISRATQITYTFNLNEPGDDEARIALKAGTKGTLVRVLQKDEDDDAFEADDWYDAVDVECGIQNVVEGEDNALDRIQQKMFIQGKWAGFKQLVAG